MTNMIKMWRTAAVIVALVGASSQIASGQSSCEAGLSQTLVQNNARCDYQGVPTLPSTLDTCCGLSSSSDVTDSSDGVCRDIHTDKAFCADDDCSDLGEGDELILYLTMNQTTSDETCCRTCKCIGDPDCTAFDGSHASWVLCDGRKIKNCKMGKKVCLSQVDHLGNQCQWLKGTDSWSNFLESGSPCQPNFELSGYPTMQMYKRGDFELNLTLGERGIIREIVVTSGAGDLYTMTADDCFEYDPRTHTTANTKKAWTTSKSNIPSTWSVSTPNDVEITWRIADSTAGVVIDATCTHATNASSNRFDIDSLYLVGEETDDESGYCSTGVIDRGLASVKLSGDDDYKFQQKCLAVNLPELLTTCKAVVGLECTPHSLNTYIKYWCDNASLDDTDVDGDSDLCYTNLATKGSTADRAELWVKYLCQLNHVNDVDSCMSLVSQFGWVEFLNKYSNGLSDTTATGSSATTTCVSNVSSYSVLEGDDATCALGIFVEYELTTDNWVQAFFIPQNQPPCNDELVINGAEQANLFLYPIRFRQCSLAESCLQDTGCAPTAGFDVQLTFSSTVCPLRGEGECFDTQCQLDETTSSSPQEICGTVPTSPLDVGSCESCCTTDVLLGSDLESERCRTLLTQVPFCDTETESSLCSSLATSAGNGTLTIEVELNTTDMNCCKNCAAWGDPFISAFDGTKTKWINCDGRNANCAVKEDVCITQKDQAGNTCVYNADIAALIQTGSDIGAYGSPCQSNVTLSGDATLEMYKIDGLTISITNGERSVITMLTITNADDTFHLDSAKCFDSDPYDAWSADDGTDIEGGSSLTTSFEDTDSSNQKRWTIVDVNTGVFLKVVCIRMTSKSGFVGGYRMNIENLIDTEPQREDGEGFCVSGVIDTGLATINENGNTCQENTESLLLFCQTVGIGTCQYSTLAKVVDAWCDEAANIYTSSSDSSKACYKYINPTTSRISKNKASILNNWQELYCTAIASNREAGTSLNKWLDMCVSSIQNEGIESMVAEYGDGTSSSTANAYCASSVSAYGKQADADPCMPGMTVEYYDTDSSAWTEAFFIPYNLPPCDGKLDISAKGNMKLFTSQLRFKQCLLDTTDCPVDMHEDLYCSAAQGFTVSYMYSYNTDICPTSA